MTSALIVIGLIVGGAAVVALGLAGARALRLDRLIGDLTASRTARYEGAIALLGLTGLGGALVLLLSTGMPLAVSTTGSALLLLLCAGSLSMAMSPSSQLARPGEVAGRVEPAAASESKAA